MFITGPLPDFIRSGRALYGDLAQANRRFGNGQLRALFVNPRQGVPITPDFFLIAVARQRDA